MINGETHAKKLALLILLAILLTACEFDTPTPEQPTEEVPVETQAPATELPVKTEEPPTEEPVETESPVIPTLTPVIPDFSGTLIYVVTRLESGYLLVTLSGIDPEHLLDEFSVSVNDAIFACQKINDYPDRWYCTGTMPNKAEIHVQIKTIDTDLLVWEGDSVIPLEGGARKGSGGGGCCWIISSCGPNCNVWDCDPTCCASNPSSCPSGGGGPGGSGG